MKNILKMQNGEKLDRKNLFPFVVNIADIKRNVIP